MQKLVTVLIGFSLLTFGFLILAANLILPVVGIHIPLIEPWRYWPVIVLGLGSLLFLLGLMSVRRPGWGALFIPAIPMNVIGGLLLVSSLFDYWQIWGYGWAFIILGLAVGFLFAAVSMRVIWLGIPAIIVGANGLALAFCSLTGLWSWWSVLWIVEPLSVGLVLLLVAFKTRSMTVTTVGAVFCGFVVVALPLIVGLILLGDWGFRLVFPFLLIAAGALLVVWGAAHRLRLPANL